MFESMAQWALDAVRTFGYAGLTFLLFLENVFPPIPSEVVLPLAGFLVGRGDLDFWGALLAATLGSLTGALVLYWFGRRGGRTLILRHGNLLRVHADDLDRAEGWFARYGDVVVLVARVIPLARSIVSIPAGTSRMPLARFSVLTTVGSALWNAVMIGAGKALGANWDRVSDWVGRYSDAVLVALAAGAALFLGIRRFRRNRPADQSAGKADGGGR